MQILIANDAAGEGVNLQRGAHLMVNYDLPWNPNRLEQRFGRIHRIGQTEVCHLWNLVAADTREGEVYHRLLDKIEEARRDLGGRVYDVLGELFERRSLKDLLVEAIRYGERPEVRARLFDTGQAWLPEIGLYHYKARAYAPALGKFLQPDPIGYGDGLNMYAYAGNDPINFTDPWGLQQQCIDPQKPGKCFPVETPPTTVEELVVSVSRSTGWTTPTTGVTPAGDSRTFDGGAIEPNGQHMPTPCYPTLLEDRCASGKAGDLAPLAVATGCALFKVPCLVPLIPGKKEILFKTSHYGPRLAKAGFNVSRVESAVAAQLRGRMAGMVRGQTVQGRVVVDNQYLLYRAQMLQNGNVQVATIHVPSGATWFPFP